MRWLSSLYPQGILIELIYHTLDLRIPREDLRGCSAAKLQSSGALGTTHMFAQLDWDFSPCSVGNLEHSVLVDTCVRLHSILLHVAPLFELLTVR
jgi:hypothetical protein